MSKNAKTDWPPRYLASSLQVGVQTDSGQNLTPAWPGMCSDTDENRLTAPFATSVSALTRRCPRWHRNWRSEALPQSPTFNLRRVFWKDFASIVAGTFLTHTPPGRVCADSGSREKRHQAGSRAKIQFPLRRFVKASRVPPFPPPPLPQTPPHRPSPTLFADVSITEPHFPSLRCCDRVGCWWRQELMFAPPCVI